VATAGSAVLGVLVALSGAVFAPRAGAGPIVDAEPVAANLVVERIIQLDAMLRANDGALPEAERVVAVTAIALDAARVAEHEALAAVPAAPPPTTPPPAPATPTAPAAPTPDGQTVVDAAAEAILGDLAPERATQARIGAELTAASAVQQRDTLVFTSGAARDERLRLLASLDEHGQARTRWSIGLLDALRAPITHENLRGLSAWIAAEGHNASALNPLATTMSAPGDQVVNDHGVRAYPSDMVGIDATIRTLHNGRYDEILAALAAGASALRIVAAVAASPWGTGENAVRRLALDSR
jgi:hypothetical protein